jgi:hypothetical protein
MIYGKITRSGVTTEFEKKEDFELAVKSICEDDSHDGMIDVMKSCTEGVMEVVVLEPA